MGEEKQDLRVQKTQRALGTAMFSLLEGQSFGKITVNDLCTEAMVSRSAFYAHFEDKYALLLFCVEVLKTQLFDESEGLDLEGRLASVLEKIRENVKLFRNLAMAEVDMELMEMMRKSFHRDFERSMDAAEAQGLTPPGPADIISIFMTIPFSTRRHKKGRNWCASQVVDRIVLREQAHYRARGGEWAQRPC